MPKKRRTRYQSFDQDVAEVCPGDLPQIDLENPEDLSLLAKATGSVQRWKKVRSGDTLLHMIMLWAVCNLSFRSVAANLHKHKRVELIDDAVRYRCRTSLPFLLALLSQAWSQPRQELVGGEHTPEIWLYDASSIEAANAKLHVVFDLISQTIRGISIDTANSGETIERLPQSDSPKLIVADSHYGVANQILIATLAGYYVLARTNMTRIKARDAQTHELLDSNMLLDLAQSQGMSALDVVIRNQEKRLIAVRLITIPLSEEKANLKRMGLRKKYQKKKGKMPSKNALRQAGFFSIVTTLPVSWVNTVTLLKIYRSRWQIELIFKRAKSIVGLENFGKEYDEMKRIKLIARLFFIMLLMRRIVLDWIVRDERGQRAFNLWRQMVLHNNEMQAQLSLNQNWLTEDQLDLEVQKKLSSRLRKRTSITLELWDFAKHTLGPLPDIDRNAIILK